MQGRHIDTIDCIIDISILIDGIEVSSPIDFSEGIEEMHDRKKLCPSLMLRLRMDVKYFSGNGLRAKFDKNGIIIIQSLK